MLIKNILNSVDDPTETAGERTIPAMSVKDDNTIFLCYGKRISGPSDIEGGVETQIWFTKSVDGGETFSSPTLAIDSLGAGDGSDDPQLTYNSSTGRLHLIATTNVGLTVGQTPFQSAAPFVYSYSDNEGLTWSTPVTMTAPYDKQVVSTGNGIEVDGRIVLPLYCSPIGGGDFHPVMMYSDNDGSTWNFSPLIRNATEYGGENKVIYVDGTYYVFTRRLVEGNGYRFCYKSDDLLTWEQDFSRSNTLSEVSVAFGLAHKDGVTYHSDQNPDPRIRDDANRRYGMSIRVSKNIFQTTEKSVDIVQRSIGNQYAFTAYSVMHLSNTVGYLLYEGSSSATQGEYRSLNLVKFNIDEV